MKLTKAQMDALRARVTRRDKSRAQAVKLFPQLANLSVTAQSVMGLNPDAVRLVMAEMAEQAEQPSMHGTSESMALSGWHVVAREPLKRFFALLAPLGAFSTTYAQDYVLAGNPNVKPKLEIPICDDSGEAALDNYNNFDTRDSASSSSAEITLHKIDDVITVYARDIERGIEVQPLLDAMLSRVAKKIMKFTFDNMKVGTVQADDSTKTKKVTAVTVPAIGNDAGKFNFGYANQVLSEVIQPRVHALLVDSAHYGALKAANKESLSASDVDVDLVAKVQDTDSLGTGAVGLAANKRGAAVGLAAPYFIPGAYDSVEQLQHEGAGCPISIATYYIPGINAIKIVAATYVGVAVTDASAIKPLVPAAS